VKAGGAGKKSPFSPVLAMTNAATLFVAVLAVELDHRARRRVGIPFGGNASRIHGPGSTIRWGRVLNGGPMRALCFFCCLLIAAVPAFASRAQGETVEPSAQAADATHESKTVTRAYVMNGLLGEVFNPKGMYEIAGKLRARGAIVRVGSWTQADEFEADACAHYRDRIIIVGYSMGAARAATIATEVRACGARGVTMIGVDPPAIGGAVGNGVHAVNFVGVLGGSIAGARNVPVPGLGHLDIINDRTMQNRVIAAAFSH
jgi:hypothetical protein